MDRIVHTRRSVTRRRSVWLLLLAACLVSAPARGELLRFHGEMHGGPPEGNFFLYPAGGTGSAATASVDFLYDTQTHLATDIAVRVRGLSTADLANPCDSSHVHEPGGPNRVVDIGPFCFSDVPGGMLLTAASVAVSAAHEPALLAGQAWANVHTAAYPNGEIAGPVVQVQRVPGLSPAWWPALVALLVFAAARTGVRRRT
ncbi:MAG: CHRD domain-containing protein [Myxococcota bacterium]